MDFEKKIYEKVSIILNVCSNDSSVNRLLICDPTNIPTLILAVLILEKFCNKLLKKIYIFIPKFDKVIRYITKTFRKIFMCFEYFITVYKKIIIKSTVLIFLIYC